MQIFSFKGTEIKAERQNKITKEKKTKAKKAK
jgi:hypothetical protein